MLRSLIFPLFATLALHTALVLMFVVDWSEDDPRRIRKPPPSFVNAKLVSMDQIKPKPAAPKPKPAPKQLPKPPPKDDSAQKLAEQKKQVELKKHAEQKKQAELKRQADQKKREQAQQQVKVKAEQERAEKARREQQEQARQQQEEQQRELRERQQRELAAAIESEEEVLAAEGDQALVNSYLGLIQQAVTNQWSRPPSARNGMAAVLRIQLVPTGEVVSVTVIESSGDSAFDRSAELAVKKAERFPELQQLPPRVFEQNFRQLKMLFKPEDLRR